MTVATASSAPSVRTLADRLLAAVPLLSIFLWLTIVYAVEAWAHGTPWLFGDELELTQLSRAIADTGHAARRGAPHSFDTLWTYVMAPAWLIDNVHTAYSTVKDLGVVLMTATAVRLTGAGVVLSALLGHRSYEWLIATGFYKSRMVDLGLNAAGALTIGLGVLPVVAGLAALWRAPGEEPSRALSCFRGVLLAAI